MTPDVYDHLGQDKVAHLLTAEEMRYDREEKRRENQPPPVTKVRESWANLPAWGDAADGLHLNAEAEAEAKANAEAEAEAESEA